MIEKNNTQLSYTLKYWSLDAKMQGMEFVVWLIQMYLSWQIQPILGSGGG